MRTEKEIREDLELVKMSLAAAHVKYAVAVNVGDYETARLVWKGIEEDKMKKNKLEQELEEVTVKKQQTAKFVNLTPHPVHVYADDGEKKLMTIEPSGTTARVKTESLLVDTIAGVPIFQVGYGEPENLPQQKEGVYLIVSTLVATHPKVRGREDILSPGDLIRDNEGRIKGCKGLKRV